MKLKTEIMEVGRGVRLEHVNGWMLETWVGRALGYRKNSTVRALPIFRVDMRKIGRKTARNHYRVEDVIAYLDSHFSVPEDTAPARSRQ